MTQPGSNPTNTSSFTPNKDERNPEINPVSLEALRAKVEAMHPEIPQTATEHMMALQKNPAELALVRLERRVAALEAYVANLVAVGVLQNAILPAPNPPASSLPTPPEDKRAAAEFLLKHAHRPTNAVAVDKMIREGNYRRQIHRAALTNSGHLRTELDAAMGTLAVVPEKA